MMSAGPPNAPTGMPPPMILPSTVKSPRTPYAPCAPCGPTRKPVITSSIISRLPAASQRARTPSRKPGCGGTQLMLPATGSMMTAATPSPAAAAAAKTASTESKSLKRAVSVSRATAAGTPSESGTPPVSAPEPAFTSKPSAWPW